MDVNSQLIVTEKTFIDNGFVPIGAAILVLERVSHSTVRVSITPFVIEGSRKNKEITLTIDFLKMITTQV